jgi:hypothetical protein
MRQTFFRKLRSSAFAFRSQARSRRFWYAGIVRSRVAISNASVGRPWSAKNCAALTSGSALVALCAILSNYFNRTYVTYECQFRSR